MVNHIQKIEMNRQQAKKQLIEALSDPATVPLLSVWYNPKTLWSYTFDNLLHTDAQARKALADIIWNWIGEIKLFREMGKKAD